MVTPLRRELARLAAPRPGELEARPIHLARLANLLAVLVAVPVNMVVALAPVAQQDSVRWVLVPVVSVRANSLLVRVAVSEVPVVTGRGDLEAAPVGRISVLAKVLAYGAAKALAARVTSTDRRQPMLVKAKVRSVALKVLLKVNRA